jgi:hypothetical protein
MPQKLKKSKNPLDGFLFDDCPICRAMKATDEPGRGLSHGEFMKAFAEANKKTDK